jgi:radical SAM/Cys-rich protein
MAINPSMLRREHPLASAEAQVEFLAHAERGTSFRERLLGTGLIPYRPLSLEVLQINIGRRCNQTCSHCHVDAGPDRKEEMSDAVVDACLRLLAETQIETLDVTGGAPELHPRFRDIVTRGRALGRRVVHRCNLTAILLPAYSDIPELLAEHGVEVVASLPNYLPKQTDRQRGEGVFDASLQGLRRLNELGYGRDGSGLILNLVTNPVGAFLPPPQSSLERDWKRQLEDRYQIVFNELFTIANMPISRFLEFLVDSGNFDDYLQKLQSAFNPSAAAAAMCRSMISVDYDGNLYDCDFNQMLGMGVRLPQANILEQEAVSLVELLLEREIVVSRHCFGCAAGAGSSCGGSVA